MRKRFCATIRKPAFSIMALMAPVRFRVVASGLRIEKVRSTAIGSSLLRVKVRPGKIARLIAAGSKRGKMNGE